MTTPSDSAFDRRLLLGAAGLAALAASRANAGGGPLNPPAGAVASTQKPLAELEPRTAINATNTPGDADSVFKITVPGSYYLTGNIVLTAAEINKNAIEVAASGVTIDLCGFEIAGQGVPGGNVCGINVPSSGSEGTCVMNGTVRNWGGPGLNLKPQSLLSGVRVISCGRGTTQPGVRVWEGSVVERCTITSSGASAQGLRCDERCVVRDCTVTEAGTYGISVGPGSTIERCVAWQTGSGIRAEAGSVRRGCVSVLSCTNCFQLLDGAAAFDCTARDAEIDGFSLGNNASAVGCSATAGGTGFSLMSGAVVRDCTAANNATYGFSCPQNMPHGRIEGCMASANGTGFFVAATACFLARNTATASTVNNWNVVAGNHCLVVAAAAGTAVLGNSGGISPGSTNPNANYTI